MVIMELSTLVTKAMMTLTPNIVILNASLFLLIFLNISALGSTFAIYTIDINALVTQILISTRKSMKGPI